MPAKRISPPVLTWGEIIGTQAHRYTNANWGTFEVLRLCPNVTGRQLQWWDENDVVSPIMVGHARQYRLTEIILIQLIIELRARRVSLQKIRPIIRTVSKIMNRDGLKTHCPPYLIVDGRRVEFCDNAGSALASLCLLTTRPIVLSIEAITNGIAARWRTLPSWRQPDSATYSILRNFEEAR